MTKVLGMGNALVDIITRIENDGILKSFGLPKGSMTLVDLDTSNFIYSETAGMNKTRASGGSAANTIHGLAHLGVETGFVGTVGNDDMGRFFKKDLQVNKIKPILFRTINETGRAMALISKDSERTFATYLGAAVDLSAEDISQDIFVGYDYFYIEGYLVQNREMFEKALRLASVKGMIICLDLASYNIVEDNVDFFRSMIHKYVDILFANEQESFAFTGLEAEEAVVVLSEISPTVILKVGAEGSWLAQGTEKVKVTAFPVNCVDTTGAGDLYAAGFLYALANGLPLEQCGVAGSLMAGKVIEIVGARMDKNRFREIKNELAEILSGN